MRRSLAAILCLATAVGTRGMDGPTIGIARVLDEPTADSREMVLKAGETEEKLLVDPNVQIDDRDLEGLEVVEGPEVALRITMTAEGSQKFAALTRGAIGKRLAILADGQLVSAPVIRQEITGNSIVLAGILTPQEVAALVAMFNQAKETR